MKNREISWTNIYSLQLLPAVVLWVLTPLLEARTTIVASMAVGVVWIVVSIFLSKLYKGCGTIGWVVGWALAVSGVLWLGLALLHLPFVPMVLFQAPFMALLTYLFEQRNIQPPFCQQCVIKRGGIWERNLLGDYTSSRPTTSFASSSSEPLSWRRSRGRSSSGASIPRAGWAAISTSSFRLPCAWPLSSSRPFAVGSWRWRFIHRGKGGSWRRMQREAWTIF